MHKKIGVLMYQTSTSKGQELVAQRMVRDFIALGHEAYLITSVYHDGKEVISSGSLMKGKGYVLAEDSELGIPIIRVASYHIKWPRRRVSFRDFVQVLEKIVDEFRLNVLITHSTLWNGPEETAKFVAWRRYMKDLGGYTDPIVFCHMSHYQEPSPKHYSLVERTFRMSWNRLSLSQILKTANLVLVVTELEKMAKISLGADPKKCFIFPSGVDEESFLRYASVNPSEFLTQHQIPRNAKLISYLGTLEERKNPEAILKIAEVLKDDHDVHFVIAGRGDSRYAEKLKEQARGLANVSFLGEIDEKDKILLIKCSFLNILMSRVEALGLSQLEFMYTGVPIITSAVGGQSWLIRNGREGIHVQGPEDIAGAAKTIQHLVENDELWKKLSSNAKERARTMASSRFIRELDSAITEEMIKESDLVHIPHETLQTLTEPEHVLKTWSSGSWGVVATERRLFVKHGRLSRKVTEIPYDGIWYVEHMRRYPWRIFAAGLLPALILLSRQLWQSVLNSDFTSAVTDFALSLPINISSLTLIVALGPLLLSLALFAAEARTGFNLCGSGIKPVYLPHAFREVISFIRNVQNRQQIPLALEHIEPER